MMTPAKRLAATLGIGLAICCAARAQTVTNDVTTGAVVPEYTVVPAPATTVRNQTVTVGVTVGLGETDNIFLTPNNQKTQTIALTGVDFGWIRTGSAFDANVTGNFDYLDYLQGAYGSQLLGRFDGLTNLSLFDDHLKWYLQDDFGEGQLNPYTPATPGNLEQVNFFMTGPEVTLHPLSETVLEFGARYALATYQTSPFNGNRATENVLLERLLSDNSNVALGAEMEELRFDDTAINSDYDRSKAYVRYSLTGARTQVTAAAGVARNDDGGAWASTPLVQLNLTHQLTTHTTLYLNAGRDFTDAADTFSDLRAGAAGGIVVAPVALTTEDYLRNYGTAGVLVSGLRTTLGATAYWERDTYAIDDTFNVTRGSLELRATRQLSATLSGDVFGLLLQSRYFDQGGEINGRAIGADVSWRAGRTLEVAGRYSHTFQGTSGGGYGYAANTVFVTVTYRPLQADQQLPLQQQQQQQQ
jgi:hypothetical protein